MKTLQGRFHTRFVTGIVPLLAVLAVAAGCGSSGGSASAPAGAGTLVRTEQSPKLAATVLANRQGRTLYALSAETGGRFICTTTACLSLWKPLTVSPGTTPTGTVGQLGTVRRPGGAGLQVTYHGMPLYTFADDHRAGDAAGNGFRDVGTWRAVTVGGAAAAAPQASTGGRSYGGGY